MLIGGLQKTTLIDYPGQVACTVFIVGCNFRCPFCHNRDLVSLDLFQASGLKAISEEFFFEFLKKRQKILDGVCITGGEPTIHPELPVFIQKIKKLKYLVKLDTNGSRPEVIAQLLQEKLIDYLAMDIKGDLENYGNYSNLKSQKSKILKAINKSISLILNSGIDFEFRTTVVPGLHNQENLVKLAKQLKKTWTATFPWVLQPFRPQNCLEPKFLKVRAFNKAELKEFLEAVKKILPQTSLRGEELTAY